ncbi:KH domain-containing protein [Astathelohania contejeani]|uniref:KH domain-containing protein n=1 Tax=Astathelohania contejeani TaxID=164912 RepID=A0ABQ7HYV8_9MICR|nr:KH domain-containing protein [Thelohania contejeani]
MDDAENLDKLKKRFYLTNPFNYKLYFGINMDDSISDEMKAIIVNESIQDFRRVMMDFADISYTKMYNGNAKIHVYNVNRYLCDNPLPLLKHAYRYFYKIHVPMCLYPHKSYIIKKIDEIGRETSTIIRLEITNKVIIYINGKETSGLKAKEDIVCMIERLLGREVTEKNGYISVHDMIRRGYRVFYSSKINIVRALVSSEHYNVVQPLKAYPSNRTRIRFDSLKLAYLLYYQRLELENLLCCHDSYLEVEDNKFDDLTEVTIISFGKSKLEAFLESFKKMFYEIVKATTTNFNPNCDVHRIFVFEKQGSFLAVGLKHDIKRLVSLYGASCEVEMELDPDLEEFLSGKKNGKINKIIKDTQCNILLKGDNFSKELSVFIGGRNENVVQAFDLLDDEFPAELAFFLDEKHHKKIIGYGGKNIQRIMKKHGVYIKFMGEKERRKFGLEGNVIIKTPRKNADSLQKMKKEVLLLADEKEIESNIISVKIGLIDSYSFNFRCKEIYYDHAIIKENGYSFPPYYTLVSLEDFIINRNDNKPIVVYAQGKAFYFLHTFSPSTGKIVEESMWMFDNSIYTFKVFDSVLLYSYKSLFNHPIEEEEEEVAEEVVEEEEEDVDDIEFSKRSPRLDGMGSILSVGFQKNSNDSSMK